MNKKVIESEVASQIPYLTEGRKESSPGYTGCLQILTIAKLFDDSIKEPTPIVEDLLYRGQVSILAAHPKIGKSTLARWMCRQIAGDHSFLGRRTTQSRILYLGLDEHIYMLKRDFQIMGVPIDNQSIQVVCESLEGRGLAEIEKLVSSRKYDLIIVDTLIHAISVSDINEYAATYKAMTPLVSLARQFDVHIMLIHHGRKGGTGQAGILGSTALTGAVDANIWLEKLPNGRRKIESTQRLGRAFEGQELTFDSVNKSFEISLTTLSEDLLEDRIRTLLKESPGLVQDEIRERLKVKASTLSTCLKKMDEDGVLKSDGRPRRYYLNEGVDSEGGRDE